MPPIRERPPLYVYDDARARTFEPFALTRPIGTLVAGTIPVWARWQVALQAPVAGLLGAPHLAAYTEHDAPAMATGTLPAGAIVVNARFAPAGEVIPHRGSIDLEPGYRSADANATAWHADGQVAAVRLKQDMDLGAFADGSLALADLAADGPPAEIEGWWHEAVWDYVRHLPAMLTDDIERSVRDPQHVPTVERIGLPSNTVVLGSHPVVAHASAGRSSTPRIDPYVVFDASAGPIYLAAGAHIRAFSRLTGPCYIGRDATVMGGEVTGCSIGPQCKVRGEISSSLMHGYSNKGHDGFIGHSYLGRWVNLGAGTITSNLKNTYGSVAFWTPDGIVDTGMQFLGTLFGDHAKTGIGLTLTTGTMLGAGANVYGSAMPPKAVAPFAWGDGEPYAEYRIDKFLEAAERMMARRHVELTAGARAQLEQAFARRYPVTDQR